MPYIPTRIYLPNYSQEVQYLFKYIAHLDQSVERHGTLMSNYLKEDIRDNGVQNENALIELYRDDLIIIPTYYYHSSYLLIYSLLESSLQDICKRLYTELQLPLKPDEIKGSNYLESSLKYIRSFTSTTTDLENKGNDFIPYQRVRNHIVHSGSSISISSKDFKFKLFGKDITYEQDGSFYINNSKFLTVFLTKVEVFIKSYVDLIESLEIIPVMKKTTGIVKYFTQKEYNSLYDPLSRLAGDGDELPF